jgi:hypothetical protein
VRRSRPALLATSALMLLVCSVPLASAKSAPKMDTSVAAFAALPCAASQSSTLFAPWGDPSSYTPFPGATFENGGESWSWSGGAAIVSGDDDHLLTVAGSHAMQIPGGGSATSPTLCTDSTMPSMRFFIRRVSGTGKLTISGSIGSGKTSSSLTLATVTGSTTWAPTPPVVFPSDLVALVGAGSLDAQFTFTADRGSTFRIDDVAMDPYRRT